MGSLVRAILIQPIQTSGQIPGAPTPQVLGLVENPHYKERLFWFVVAVEECEKCFDHYWACVLFLCVTKSKPRRRWETKRGKKKKKKNLREFSLTFGNHVLLYHHYWQRQRCWACVMILAFESRWGQDSFHLGMPAHFWEGSQSKPAFCIPESCLPHPTAPLPPTPFLHPSNSN